MYKLWLGCLVVLEGYGPLRHYFSLYRTVSQREGERGEIGQMRVKMSKQTPTRTHCKRIRLLPYCNPNCRTPGTGSLPSTIAPPDHPLQIVARTSSIYYHLIIRPLSVTSTIKLPGQMFQWHFYYIRRTTLPNYLAIHAVL